MGAPGYELMVESPRQGSTNGFDYLWDSSLTGAPSHTLPRGGVAAAPTSLQHPSGTLPSVGGVPPFTLPMTTGKASGASTPIEGPAGWPYPFLAPPVTANVAGGHGQLASREVWVHQQHPHPRAQQAAYAPAPASMAMEGEPRPSASASTLTAVDTTASTSALTAPGAATAADEEELSDEFDSKGRPKMGGNKRAFPFFLPSSFANRIW
jgi:hypothetical protein